MIVGSLMCFLMVSVDADDSIGMVQTKTFSGKQDDDWDLYQQTCTDGYTLQDQMLTKYLVSGQNFDGHLYQQDFPGVHEAKGLNMWHGVWEFEKYDDDYYKIKDAQHKAYLVAGIGYDERIHHRRVNTYFHCANHNYFAQGACNAQSGIDVTDHKAALWKIENVENHPGFHRLVNALREDLLVGGMGCCGIYNQPPNGKGGKQENWIFKCVVPPPDKFAGFTSNWERLPNVGGGSFSFSVEQGFKWSSSTTMTKTLTEAFSVGFSAENKLTGTKMDASASWTKTVSESDMYGREKSFSEKLTVTCENRRLWQWVTAATSSGPAGRLSFRSSEYACVPDNMEPFCQPGLYDDKLDVAEDNYQTYQICLSGCRSTKNWKRYEPAGIQAVSEDNPDGLCPIANSIDWCNTGTGFVNGDRNLGSRCEWRCLDGAKWNPLTRKCPNTPS